MRQPEARERATRGQTERGRVADVSTVLHRGTIKEKEGGYEGASSFRLDTAEAAHSDAEQENNFLQC